MRKNFNYELYKDLVLNSLEEVVIYYDKDMKILYANKSSSELFGISPEDLIGKSCYELWYKRESCKNCPVKRVLKTGKIEEGEIISPDGRSWHIKGYPAKNEQGETIGVVELIQEITEKKRMEDEIKYLSFHDKLTGLYNRAFFEEELIRLNTKRQLPLSIIMGDLNGLKLVNDTFGHKEGDNLLIAISKVLRKSCRKEDIIARWGGDEFVILLPKTDKFTSQRICERIKRNCENHNKLNNHPIQLSISLGSATKENENENIEEILKLAEDRMYRNKLIEGKTFRDSVLSSLKNFLWEISFESKSHEERIKELSLRMADFLYLSDIEREELILLSYFHDIGEITIPKEILKKPYELSPEEWNEIKTHPEVGYRIAEASYELAHIAEKILAHHEWWNGSGYPQGLKGEEIPLVSRIFSIVDAYEVIMSGRPYKKAKTKEEAIEEIKRCSGTQFDPKLVDAFINVIS
ncbi:MAG: diguanylate cyclase domain-containing protein [Dictyoglomaceae bacterium]